MGEHVTEWKKGDRVGVGWHGGHDFVCEACRRGDFIQCANEQITGITRDGGYQQYMFARHEAVASMPDGLEAAEAGPLLCAGITTFNSLRHSGAKMGDLVAVLGIGGLGHLGIQFAAKGGFRTVALGRGPQNAALPMELSVLPLIMARRAIQGWPSGTAMDSQDTLRFSAMNGVRPMIEKFALKDVKKAYERMISGDAQFRVVLTM